MKMQLRFKGTLLFLLLSSILFFVYATAEVEHEISGKLRTAPHKNVGNIVIDGTGTENSFSLEDTDKVLGDIKSGSSKVSVSTVALFTLAMAAATGLGAVPFFFVELDPQWAGLCNGMAAGVMLAASFDLIEEGHRAQNAGNWVVIGILAGGIFILLCKKVMTLVFHFSHHLSGSPFHCEYRVFCFSSFLFMLHYAYRHKMCLQIFPVLL